MMILLRKAGVISRREFEQFSSWMTLILLLMLAMLAALLLSSWILHCAGAIPGG